ncbi:MAG TPA: hypothetical protein PK691_01735 [Thermomicrobiales bacterium]|nr:hypothetical protein [Thermomicrobiales bacterium]
MHRFLAAVTAALSLFFAFGLTLSGVSAQDATPSPFANYPQLNITITDSTVTLDQSTVPSGWISVNLTNNSSDESGVGLLAAPEGQSLADLLASAATPTADDDFPPFMYTSVIAGGPSGIDPGGTGSQIVHLTEGDWAAFPEGQQTPAPFTVKTTADSMETPPTATATITMSNFLFAGWDQLVVGQQTLAVTNKGDQPHMLVFEQVPDGTTIDQLKAALGGDESGTPVTGGFDVTKVMPVPGGDVIMLSTNQTAYINVDLGAGTYVALCFVTDPATGKLHAMLGMASLFTVGSVATPTA